MKKICMLIAGVMMVTSCGSTETGMFSGAMFGSIIGSCIGGISGGPRGSDIGTLVGMATGAATGAAIGHHNEQEYYAQASRSSSANDDSGYSREAVYNDVIAMQPSRASEPQAQNDTTVSITALQRETQQMAEESLQYPLSIENVRFINGDNTQHIARGELVKISFEIRNLTNSVIYSLVPTVQETTGNKRIFISPSTQIESIVAKSALRYTAFVSAQKNLKTGTAHFVVSVKSGNSVISNVVEFDIPLN